MLQYHYEGVRFSFSGIQVPYLTPNKHLTHEFINLLFFELLGNNSTETILVMFVIFGKDFLRFHYTFLQALHAASYVITGKSAHVVLQAFLRLTEMRDGKVAPLINYD